MASVVLAAPASAANDAVLLAGAPQQISAALGDEFDVTLSVTNTGTTALNSVGIVLHTDWAFEAVEQFSNCDYEDGRPRLCTFGQTLAPGKSYRVALPYKARADTYAPGGIYGEFEWLTADEYPGHSGGTPGAGGVLQLREGDRLGASENGAAQTVDVAVTGANGADLGAIGDEVSGAAGAQVQATVGVRNDGPATLDGGRGGSSLGEIEVTLPAGTSFVSAPGCGRGEDASHYICAAPYLFTAGTTSTWTFTLKINKVVPDAQGTVVVNPPCQCKRVTDLDDSDNTALLVANPTPGGGADQLDPVIAGTGLLDGQQAPAKLVFHPAVADNVAVTELGVTVNGSLAADCTLRNGCEVSLAGLPSDTEATVTVWAADAAGNRAEKSVKVHVDNVLPTAAFSPAMGSSVPSGPVAITLTGVSGDVWRVDVFDGGTRTNLPEAPWTYAWAATSGATSPTFVLYDRAGNTTTLATGYVVSSEVVDDKAPVIAQVDFAGAYSTNRLDTGTGWVGGVSTLRPTIQDESAITRTEWKVDGVLRSSDPAFSWNTRAFAASTATVGLQVWDAAGNTSSKSFKVNIDKSGPTMSVTPGQNALIRGTSYVTSLKASDAHGVAVMNLAGRSGSVTWVRLSSGRDGAKTITWMAVDKLGNSASATRTVIVDNTAPAVKVAKAPKNKSKLTRKVTLAASASDRNGVAKVQLLVNGKVVATDTKAGYRFVLNPKKYGKTFKVQLRAYDKAGNVRYSTKRTYRR
ncbi:Ig-like domain-containing protein [Actinoplanes sp. GCM10030250]|uniref:Ig-like domain-containing protein n=1 Tax=Actinoplanes sp. GCM10030250 TaxID=3273376 RepID=UPI003622E140